MPNPSLHGFLRTTGTPTSTPERLAQQMTALVGLLNRQQAVMERTIFKLSEAALLASAGEDRFLGYIVDEVTDAQDEIGVIDAMRALLVSDIATDLGITDDDVSLKVLIDHAPDAIAPALSHQRETLLGLVEQLEGASASGATSIGAKLELVTDSIGRMEDGAHGRSPYAEHGGYQSTGVIPTRFFESA